MRSVGECGGCFVSHCLLSIREKKPFQFFFGFSIKLYGILSIYNCQIRSELTSIRAFLIKKFNFLFIYNCQIRSELTSIRQFLIKKFNFL